MTDNSIYFSCSGIAGWLWFTWSRLGLAGPNWARLDSRLWARFRSVPHVFFILGPAATQGMFKFCSWQTTKDKQSNQYITTLPTFYWLKQVIWPSIISIWYENNSVCCRGRQCKVPWLRTWPIIPMRCYLSLSSTSTCWYLSGLSVSPRLPMHSSQSTQVA